MPLLKALVLTLIIELLTLILLKEKKVKVLLYAACVNCFTNLTMNIILQYFPNSLYYLSVFVAEIIVIILETLLYFLVLKDIKKSIKYSFICNVLSYFIGFALIPYIY